MVENQIYQQLEKQLGFKFRVGETELNQSESIYIDYAWIAQIYRDGRDNGIAALVYSTTKSIGVRFDFKVSPNFGVSPTFIEEQDEHGQRVLVLDAKYSSWSFFNEATVTFPQNWEDPVHKALKSVDLVSNVFDGIIEKSASVSLSYYAASLNRYFSLKFRSHGEDNVSLQHLAAKIYEFRAYHLSGE